MSAPNDDRAPSGLVENADFLDVKSFVPSSLKDDLSIPRLRESRRIHILGAGNTGRFVAHAIASLPDRPPITLIFRSVGMLRTWKKCGRSIEVVTDGYGEKRHGFDTEVLPSGDAGSLPNTSEKSAINTLSSPDQQPDSTPSSEQHVGSEKIHQLIISVKAPFVIRALSQIAHRLSRESSILLFPSGIGILEEVNQIVFPDENTRPTYVNGLITHNLRASDSDAFTVVHAGMGTIALGIAPRHSMVKPWTEADMVSHLAPSARYIVRTLTRIPVLAAVGFAPTDMFQLQIERLVVNAVVGPLTVVMDCCNGELLHNRRISRIMRLLLAEISLVIRSLPELQGVPNVTLRFAPERLEALVVNACIATTENISPMLQDVRAARVTEVEYVTGYIVRRGEEIGIKCLMNFMILQMVKGKRLLQGKRNNEMMPMQ